MTHRSLTLIVLCFLFACSSTAEESKKPKKIVETDVTRAIISIPVNVEQQPYHIGAELTTPIDFTSRAVVVIVHGSAGLDSRGRFHRKALNNAGIATLEIDLWTARGWLDGSFDRPASVHETLPDAFAAINYLASLPQFDANKIGIMGFSWGGVVAMLSREIQLADSSQSSLRFAAHVAFYPVCWVYTAIPPYNISVTTQAPLMILTGELDDYDTPDSCDIWRSSLSESEQHLVDIHVYKNAYHGFNGFEAEKVVPDPYSHLGQGGNVTMKPNKKARKQANKAVIEFFKSRLQP